MQDEMHKGIEVRCFRNAAEFESWLDAHHAASGAFWMKFAKKGSAISTISYEEARELALAFGWIDGLVNRWDDDFYVLRFSPRRPRSVWSKINCEIVEGLIRDGKMRPSGMIPVEDARKDGRWDAAYAGSATMEVPDYFRDALAQDAEASAFFDSLNAANRYAVLFRLTTAHTEKMRATRLEKIMTMLRAKQLIHPLSS